VRPPRSLRRAQAPLRRGRRRPRRGDLSIALDRWRAVFDLLPPGTRQHEAVLARIRELSDLVASGDAAPSGRASTLARGTAGLGAIALFVWKFKFILAFVATKGKVLLLGLTKLPTLLSMFAFFGVYWSAFGWPFALGLVLSIYIHEMGHVFELRRFGIAASAPMFIPGIGALVRLKQYPVTPCEDSRVGLAGPVWGLGAALAAWLLFLATGTPVIGAIAKMGAVINLFNLLPVWQLDGGRGFRSLNRSQRAIAVLAAGAGWFFTANVWLLLITIVGIFRIFQRDRPAEADRVALVQWIVLIAALGALTTLPVPLS
jgi:Zn-dependent protease